MIGLITLMAIGLLGASFVGAGVDDSGDSDNESAFDDEHENNDVSERDLDGVSEIEGYLFSSEALDQSELIFGTNEDDVLGERSSGEHHGSYHIFGGPGNDYLIGATGDVLIGGEGEDTFEGHSSALINILDFDETDTIIIKHFGEQPQLDAMTTDEGVSLFANGSLIVNLNGVYDLDFSQIRFERDQV